MNTVYRKYASSISLVVVVLALASTRAAPISDDDPTTETAVGREKRESFGAIDLLIKYGYLEQGNTDMKTVLMSQKHLSAAVRSYQRFNGLEETGALDKETLDKMKTPRCGVADLHPSTDPNQPSSFVKLGSQWRKDTVSWRPTSFSKKLSEGEQWTAFQEAFDLWSQPIPTKFRFSKYEPDIEITFAKGDHGDGWRYRFDGLGGVLAHAYPPGAGIGGDSHFDEDENWTVGTGEGSDLTTVAAHEFGHALGLAHSSVPGALMAPYYQYKGRVHLHADDILGIQSLYGVKATTTEGTTTTATTTNTMTTTTTTTETPEQEDFCKTNFRLDAITEGGDGYMYAFRQDKVYKIGSNGIEDGYPKIISDVFPEAPRQHIRAVSYVPENKKIYMFKDLRVWRFTDISQEESIMNDGQAKFQLDQGYPKSITTDSYYRPSAALTLTYKGVSQLFLFSWDYFWEWDIRSEQIVPGYPLASAKYFPHAPGHPDASLMNKKGNIIFFKYNTYKFLYHRGMDGETQALGPNLLGSKCGGEATIFQHGDFAWGLNMNNEALAYDPMPTFNGQPEMEEDEQMELSPQLWSLVILRRLEMTVPDVLPPSNVSSDMKQKKPFADKKRNFRRKMRLSRY